MEQLENKPLTPQQPRQLPMPKAEKRVKLHRTSNTIRMLTWPHWGFNTVFKTDYSLR